MLTKRVSLDDGLGRQTVDSGNDTPLAIPVHHGRRVVNRGS